MDNTGNSIRPKDLITILFFSGASWMLLVISILFIYLEATSGTETDFEELVDSMAVLRFSFILAYIVFASGFIVQIMQNYGINYLYIFELDPHYKMTQSQLFKVAVILLFMSS